MAFNNRPVNRYSSALLISALSLSSLADARTNRSREVTAEFERENPCPSTGKRVGACPGYIKDHIIALCDGGADSPFNMQWQTKAKAKVKDRTECKSAYARANRIRYHLECG
jgi:hypothetical protein